MKFAARKLERFVKTFKFEVDIPSWVIGENDAYAPRFIDEIADEIDTLEDKKASLFCKYEYCFSDKYQDFVALSNIFNF